MSLVATENTQEGDNKMPPQLRGYPPADAGERMVYDTLRRTLPDDWWLLTNVSWSTRQSRGHGRSAFVRDGEADMVVLVPNLGMVVLEVKASRFVWVKDDGKWYRSHNDRDWVLIEESPPRQATRHIHELAAKVTQAFGMRRFPGLYSYLVVYPQGEPTQGAMRLHDDSTVVFAKHMKDIEKRIRGSLLARDDVKSRQDFAPARAREVADVLSNTGLRIQSADAGEDGVDTDTNRIETLTRQQFAALQGLFRHPRVAVSGPAGSGKTVLALWRLAALVEAGAKVRFVCYNTALAQYLRLRHPDLAPQIYNVDKYFTELAGGRSSVPDTDGYFSETLPTLVVDKAADWAEDEKLDAVIIDEGQDFGEARLMALHYLLKEDGSFLYCADCRQDLYDRATREAVGAEIVFSLVHNCRNTVAINDDANCVLDSPVESMPGSPPGVKPTIRVLADTQAMAATAWKLAREWIGDGGRVAFLSPYRLENSSLDRARSFEKMKLVTTLDEWDAKGVVFFSTIKSFKGLEADAVVVMDLDGPDEKRALSASDLYVACTRGRSRLALLSCSKKALARFPTR